ncbi:MAG: hypothetical protein JOZ51_02670 [Chloroflexi bacterium]|nr:hypothetical protein [Chloroflexota bacterium]
MNRDQNTGNSDNQDLSYNERGADNLEDLTRSDENLMDRAAQAGTTGAFGEGNSSDSEQLRRDAEDAFGGSDSSGSSSGS